MQPVTIYVKQTCPYCISAKRLLEHKGVVYTEFDVTKMNQTELEEVADLNRLDKEGRLDKMLSID